MEYAIGIDLGGTSIKYALVDKGVILSLGGKNYLSCFCFSCKSNRAVDKSCHVVKR